MTQNSQDRFPVLFKTCRKLKLKEVRYKEHKSFPPPFPVQPTLPRNFATVNHFTAFPTRLEVVPPAKGNPVEVVGVCPISVVQIRKKLYKTVH